MEADDERPTAAAPSIGSAASGLQTSPAQASGPAESSPALPSVIPSPVVHSPPDTAQGAGSEPQQAPTLAIPSGPERDESVDASIGAEEEEEEAVHRPFVGATRRRRPREGRADSDGSGSSNAAEGAGPLFSSSPSPQSVVGMGAMRLPVTPVGAASSPKPPSPLTIVLVGGFLLPPTDEFHRLYWGEALAGFPKHRILCVHPGPIASLHDRWVAEFGVGGGACFIMM